MADHPGRIDARDAHLDGVTVTRLWARLHAGDAEPWPQHPAVLHAWVLYHRGEFEKAADVGKRTGGPAELAAIKAICIQAAYLESSEQARLDLLHAAAERARGYAAQEPACASAWHLHGYALGRYSRGISVAKALAQGLGGQVKESLERAIALRPRHAEAHIGLAAFHAELIDKVGALVGGMTYGAKKDAGLALFEEGLRLHPRSIIGLVEYARGLLMLEGDAREHDATDLYARAVTIEPLDAAERLQVALARAELQDLVSRTAACARGG